AIIAAMRRALPATSPTGKSNCARASRSVIPRSYLPGDVGAAMAASFSRIAPLPGKGSPPWRLPQVLPRYPWRMESAPNLVLVGPMGAGKSAIGRRLAERLGLPFADVDEDIEAATGASIPVIFDCEGEAGFRARERSTLAARLAGEALVLATGGGAVLDPGNRRLLRERGYVVWLRSRVETQLERLGRCGNRPLLQ